MPRFASVVFDCDSTLAAIEGIDELAVGRRDDVAALTAAAMRGELPLEAVYGRRLDLIRPTRGAVDRLAERYLDALVPDAREAAAALRHAGVQLYIVSGGLRPPVTAVAQALRIPDSHVAAVDIHFGPAGEYAGFDAASPLTQQEGKLGVIAGWKPPIPRPSLLVGDGATDLAARPAVDAFAAYAGVVGRDAVLAGADFVLTHPSLAALVALVLEASPAARYDDLLARGRALLRSSGRTLTPRET